VEFHLEMKFFYRAINLEVRVREAIAMTNPAQQRQKLIRAVRLYPLITLVVLALGYLAGGFSQKDDPFIPRDQVVLALSIYIFLAPALYIVAFILVASASDRERKGASNKEELLTYADPFDLPLEKMQCYKLAVITERDPTLRGLTGDSYRADDSAICTKFPEHTPPVASCECGFYAYRSLADAKFESSLSPGAFLLQVDLYGIGFRYEGGYRAETQVVNQIIIPKRCMRCRILSPKVFVVSYRMGYLSHSWMQWQVRCKICSLTFKDEDKLSISEMYHRLGIPIAPGIEH
jgi:hypothetical protein